MYNIFLYFKSFWAKKILQVLLLKVPTKSWPSGGLRLVTKQTKKKQIK